MMMSLNPNSSRIAALPAVRGKSFVIPWLRMSAANVAAVRAVSTTLSGTRRSRNLWIRPIIRGPWRHLCALRCPVSKEFGAVELKQIDLADCPHCFGVHDAEIHDATTSVHIWLRQEVARKLRAGISSLQVPITELS